jgi:hypothetical protein
MISSSIFRAVAGRALPGALILSVDSLGAQASLPAFGNGKSFSQGASHVRLGRQDACAPGRYQTLSFSGDELPGDEPDEPQVAHEIALP